MSAIDSLARLIAIEEIRQLKSRYSRCMDTKDFAALRAVFADDAVFDARASLSIDGHGESGRAADPQPMLPVGLSAFS